MKERGIGALSILLLLAVLLVIFVRARLLPIPLERDEGEFAYAGQLMLEGIPPYKLAFNVKLPGTYAAYGAMMAVFGQTTIGIHIGFLLVNLASTALLFLVARRILDLESAMIACVCYALFSLSPALLSLQGHATHLVVLTALAGMWILLRGRESAGSWIFLWSGIFFGLSFLCKQPGIFFAIFGGTILLRDAFETPVGERSRQFRRIGTFCAGVISPFILTCLWMWEAGTFRRFWFWTMDYAPAHAAGISEEQVRWQLGDLARRGAALEWWGLAAIVGLVCLLAASKEREAKFILPSLLCFSLMAVLASFYLFRHYFIVLLPVASLLVTVAVRALAGRIGWNIAQVCFALACVAFVFANSAVWFQMSPVAVSRSLYQQEPFAEAIQIADYIREHSTEKDSIEVLGSEPEIYFYAHRHSASGYLYMYDLTKSTRFAPAMQKEMIHDIETARPLYLVDVHVPTSWATTRNSDQEIIEWSGDYEKQHYELVGKVVPGNNGNAGFLWGPDAATKDKDAWLSVFIFKRKPGS